MAPVALSAIRYARAWAGLRSAATCTGTSVSPIFWAAKYLVWPTTMIESASRTIGWRQPNSWMDFTTASTAAALILGLRSYGRTSLSGRISTFMDTSLRGHMPSVGEVSGKFVGGGILFSAGL